MGNSTDYEFWCFLIVNSIFGLLTLFIFLAGGIGPLGQFFEWIEHTF